MNLTSNYIIYMVTVEKSQTNKCESDNNGEMKPRKIGYTPERLREIRLIKEKSQVELAKICGISELSIRKLEANKMVPSEEMLMLLGEALNVLFYADWENKRPMPERKKPGKKRS